MSRGNDVAMVLALNWLILIHTEVNIYFLLKCFTLHILWISVYFGTQSEPSAVNSRVRHGNLMLC